MTPGVLAMDWLVLAPVLAPACGALLVLILDVLAPRARGLHLPVGMLALGAGLGALPYTVAAGAPARSLCTSGGPGARCFYEVGPWGLTLQLTALAAAMLVLLMLGPGTRRIDRAQRGGPAVTVALLLAATTGAVALAATRDLPMWLVAVELATLPGVALVALSRARGAEGGALSLLMVSLTSFGLLAVGVALWVLGTGEMTWSVTAIRTAWAQPATHRATVLAILFLIAGLAFKLSAVPFHTWTPQAFAAADEGVAAFLATVSKVAALAALLVVLAPVADLARTAGSGRFSLTVAVGAVALASMTLGNLVALRAEDPVRLLAWSTIAQGGWVLLPVAALTGASAPAAAAYLAVYVLGTLVVFAVVAAVHAGVDGPGDRSLREYAGLARRNPLLALALGLGLLTLAGLPPGVIGLVAKIVALRPVVDAGHWWLVLPAVLNVVLGVAVYLRWLLIVVRGQGGRTSDPTGPAGIPGLAAERAKLRLDPGLLIAVILACVLIILLSVAPGLLIDLALR